MTTDRNGSHIPRTLCSCGATPSGNGGHAAHRKMHQRKGDGHRPITRDVYTMVMANPKLRGDCNCGAGDQIGRLHKAMPIRCPAWSRYWATKEL
jgi:hypothetical protein